MDASLKSLHKNVMEWLAGPTGSIALHAALILALVFLVSFATKEPTDPGVEVTVVDPEEMTLDEEPLEELETPPEFEPVDAVDIPQDVDIDMPPPDIPDFAADASMINDVSELSIASDISSPIVMAGLQAGEYANRSGKGRAGAGGLAGQWAEVAEAAVSRALEWLKNNQSKDGSWSNWKNPPDRVAFASLGLLTFLAHGETTQSEKYGETITRALQFLMAKQNDKGEFATTATTAGTYGQAMAVYAVSEAYGMMRIPDLRPVMEKGVQVLIDGQHDRGGYTYGFVGSKFGNDNNSDERRKASDNPQRRDTSIGAWCCQAMKAAQTAGADNPGLGEAIEKAVGDLKRAANPDDGAFYYAGTIDKPGSKRDFNTTAMAVLAMQLTGHGHDKEAMDGMKYLQGASCKWEKPGEWPMYGWYYMTQAKFHVGGNTWTKWNSEFAPAFIRSQETANKDPGVYGSWQSAGAVFPKGHEGREDYDRVYATTLAALSLQVYYRHLQTYKPIEEVVVDQKSDDDVTVSIF